MKDQTDWQATVIKILAVVTATPRWVGALLAAEGMVIPADWSWWVIASALMSAAMAAVEGWAFSYIFEAWRNQDDTKSNRLGWLILVSAVLFVLVLAPYIATSVTHAPLKDTLAWAPALYAWSVAVGGSTIAIVASVGYAQKHKGQRKPAQAGTQPAQPIAQAAEPAAHVCGTCGASFRSQQSLAAHMRKHSARALVHSEIVTAAGPEHPNGKSH